MEINDLGMGEDIKYRFEITNPICRCCLTTGRRMIRAVLYDLLFKDLANLDVTESDGLPQWLCWECCALLRKAVRFKQKMLKAHSVLYEYSTRCAPFPIDAADPELGKYASPQLTETNILTFHVGWDSCEDNCETVTHTKPNLPIELEIPNPFTSFGGKTEDIKDELDFGSDYDYDDNVALNEYKTKLTADDLDALLGNTNSLLEEKSTKRKRKAKKKDTKTKKKKKNSDKTLDTEPPKERPKSSIRKPIEIDPTKIRIITLNPEEQVKQREEESKSGLKFPYHCRLCFQGFNYEAKLDNHMKKHSPSRGSFECKLCCMFLPTSYSLNVHNLIHTRRYECCDCGRRMTDRASILDHYRSQHEGQITMYTCEICGKISTNNKTHRGHMRNHHSGERPTCDHCDKSFVNKDALTEHILIHQGVKNYECGICLKRFRTRTQVKLHQVIHSDAKEYYCVECDIRFKTAYTLRQHLQKSMKHKDSRNFQYVCHHCEKRFETAAPLRSHILIQHEGVRAYRCSMCPSALASRASLAKHTLSVHRGMRPPPRHVCDHCGKAFRGKSVLTNHVRTHTGEKPFSCAHCGRGFTQRTSMLTHVKLVHLKIRRRPKVKPEVTVDEVKVFPKGDPGLDAWNRQTDMYYAVPV